MKTVIMFNVYCYFTQIYEGNIYIYIYIFFCINGQYIT